ncbi:phytase, partial [Gilvimarinus sp. 1_MG-2023]
STLLQEQLAIDTLLSVSNATQAGALDKHSDALISLTLPSIAATRHDNMIATVPANGETQPVLTAGDAADDPAIWVNPN